MITIDDRVGSAELLRYFTPGRAQISRLESADFAFVGVEVDSVIPVVGIERKRVHEFLFDFDRFVHNQLESLQNSYTHPMLVVEGDIRIDSAGLISAYRDAWYAAGIKAGVFFGRMQTLSELYGLRVMRTKDARETAAYIEALESWFNRTEHRSVNRFYRPAPPLCPIRPSVYRTMLSCIRGLGWDSTQTVLKAYPSMAELTQASIADLQKLPKIGKKTAEAIYAAVHTEFKR